MSVMTLDLWLAGQVMHRFRLSVRVNTVLWCFRILLQQTVDWNVLSAAAHD
jgi:hypothetical protein